VTSAPGGLRRHRRDPFVAVPSATIRDRRLSYKARGVLAYLLDQPDGWDVRSVKLAEASDHDGKAAIRTALHELAEHGYYRLERRFTHPGGPIRMGTAVAERPVPEWAAEYAEFGGQAVPVLLQVDGSYEVIRDTPEVSESYPDVPDSPGSGFRAPGDPDPGFPGARELGSINRQKTQRIPPPPSSTPVADVVAGVGRRRGGKSESQEQATARQFLATLPAPWRLRPGTRQHCLTPITTAITNGWPPDALLAALTPNPEGARSLDAVFVARVLALPDTPPAPDPQPAPRRRERCGVGGHEYEHEPCRLCASESKAKEPAHV